MEENSSILTNLCSQRYFKDIFAKSEKCLAFTAPSLDIIYTNDNFKKSFGEIISLSEFKVKNHIDSAFEKYVTLKNIKGALIFFPIVFRNQFLGYTVLFKQGKEKNNLYELNAAKHDLNNLLTIVFNLIDKANKDLAKTSLDMAKDFIDNFSLNAFAPIEILNISGTLNILLHSFSESISSSVIFISDISTDLYKVRINKTKFIRIISNIITNAVEAIPSNGQITLAAFNLYENEKDYVCIRIEDTGKGMPEKALQKIFNNDYSTKERGSGLGLSIVKKLMDEINGSIEVKSVERAGSQFILKFPAATGIKKSIALIEDDAAINELLTDLLSSYYFVSSYSDGESFFAENNINAFCLIIIDKKLPGINGIECVKNIRSANKNVKIILASGSEIEGNNALSKLAIDKVVNKPYKFDQLLSVIEELLA